MYKIVTICIFILHILSAYVGLYVSVPLEMRHWVFLGLTMLTRSCGEVLCGVEAALGEVLNEMPEQY